MTYLQKTILKIFYVSLSSLFIIHVNAQSDSLASAKTVSRRTINFSGKITDAKTGTPLPGASIYIHELNKGAASNTDGNFQINNIPAGKYLVEVSYVGYSSSVETVDLRSQQQLNVALQQTAVEQEAVTVTGVSSATRIKQNPQPVSVIQRKDFISTPATNTIDAVTKLVPGVNAVTTGPAISKLGVSI